MKKRVCAMLMVVVLVLSLAGCGNSDSKKLVGTWCGELDLNDALKESLASADEMYAEILDFNSFTIVLYAEFKEDGTVEIYADEEQAQEAFDSLIDEFVTVLEEYIVDMIYEQTGMQMTFDEILELSGMDLEKELENLGLDDLAKEMCDKIYQKGKYEAENGKLHISDGVMHNIDPTVYESYILNEDVLTLTGYVGPDTLEVDLYPIEFHRIG